MTDVVMENVRISAPTGFLIQNAKGILLRQVKVEAKRGEPFELKNAEVEGVAEMTTGFH